MKKFSTLALSCTILLNFSSCSVSNDDATYFYYEPLKITGAYLPEYFEYGKVYSIEFSFLSPTNCHIYDGFEFNLTGKTERTILAIASVIERTNCKDLVANEKFDTFNFEVQYRDQYTFKFYTGENKNGEKEYLIYNVPVKKEAFNQKNNPNISYKR